MPKVKISEYSTVNSNNTDINSINIDEGCAPSGINNAIREVMVHLKNWQTNASGDGATFASLVVQGTGSFTGAVTMSAGATLSGTNTLSGSNIMSGNINSSGSTNTFSGTVVMSGANTISHAAGTVSAPSITVNGDTNTGIFFPAADTIAFAEGGAEAMRIDSSGNVGIGTSSPVSKMDFGSSAGLSGTAGVPSFSLYSSASTVRYGLNVSSSSLDISALDTVGRITFYTGANTSSATERARIPAAGGFQCVNSISVGNATPTTSGAGITFPATQSASSNANTLDDYEEGTWTPTFSTTGNAFSSITYSIQTAYYTKIGNTVYIWGWITINAVSGGTGNITMTGLPFTNGSMQGGVTTNWADGQWTTRCPDAGHILANSTTVYLIQYGGTQTLQIPVGNAKAGSQWIFNGAYGIV